jgi:hypothetical protein
MLLCGIMVGKVKEKSPFTWKENHFHMERNYFYMERKSFLHRKKNNFYSE